MAIYCAWVVMCVSISFLKSWRNSSLPGNLSLSNRFWFALFNSSNINTSFWFFFRLILEHWLFSTLGFEQSILWIPSYEFWSILSTDNRAVFWKSKLTKHEFSGTPLEDVFGKKLRLLDSMKNQKWVRKTIDKGERKKFLKNC